LLGPEVLRIALAADNGAEAAELLNAIGAAFLKEYTEMERSKKQQRLVELRAKKDRIEEDLVSLRKMLDKMGQKLDVKDREAANDRFRAVVRGIGRDAAIAAGQRKEREDRREYRSGLIEQITKSKSDVARGLG
jgi:hypothetical protein